MLFWLGDETVLLFPWSELNGWICWLLPKSKQACKLVPLNRIFSSLIFVPSPLAFCKCLSKEAGFVYLCLLLLSLRPYQSEPPSLMKSNDNCLTLEMLDSNHQQRGCKDRWFIGMWETGYLSHLNNELNEKKNIWQSHKIWPSIFQSMWEKYYGKNRSFLSASSGGWLNHFIQNWHPRSNSTKHREISYIGSVEIKKQSRRFDDKKVSWISWIDIRLFIYCNGIFMTTERAANIKIFDHDREEYENWKLSGRYQLAAGPLIYMPNFCTALLSLSSDFEDLPFHTFGTDKACQNSLWYSQSHI